jgi:glutathione S-transferase
MITLHQPKRAFGLPCPSAFCVKLEAYLRMAEVPYELLEGEPTGAPKGKVPWITHRDKAIGDSSLVVDYLKREFGDPLDGKLSVKEWALGHAMQKMLEESLYFVSSYSKWADDESFAIYAEELFQGMSEEQRAYVPEMVRGKVLEKFKAQGIGRHSSAEVYAIGCKDVVSFTALLGDKPYLLGAAPTSFDACALGVIGNLKDGPFKSPVQDEIKASAALSGYIDRMRASYFSDLA